MTDDTFVAWLDELQRKIEYAEEQAYSPVVIQEYRSPSNFGVLDNPDAVGEIKGPCGDTMKISLRIKTGRIRDVRFWTDGCGATIACGSMLTKMINGKSVEEAANITNETLTDALIGLPEEHLHCAKLAVDTLQDAIKEYNNASNFLDKNCDEIR